MATEPRGHHARPAAKPPRHLDTTHARSGAGDFDLTNRPIGERLFLSQRTVGVHPCHLFPKLGIAARSQLAFALADASPAPVPGHGPVG